MSAKTIFDAAPLGSLIRFSDRSEKPPTNLEPELRAWERNNASGRLVRKNPAAGEAGHSSPASFTLHEAS